MHKPILLFLFILSCSLSAQTDTVIVKGTKFLTIKRTEKSEYNKKDTVLLVYRLENQAKKLLLKHYLYQWSADCNNEFTDKGKMEISGDSIIFTTKFLQKGHDPIPQRRKQIYKVTAKGKLVLIYDKQFMNNKWLPTG